MVIFHRPSITRERVRELAYEALCARTARRQRDAKAALTRHGVEPRVQIGSAYVPESVRRAYLYTSPRGIVQ